MVDNRNDPLGINKKSKEVKPAVIPIKCVVCNGFGTVTNQRITCHGCKGKGYLLVPAEREGDDIPTD